MPITLAELTRSYREGTVTWTEYQAMSGYIRFAEDAKSDMVLVRKQDRAKQGCQGDRDRLRADVEAWRRYE